MPGHPVSEKMNAFGSMYLLEDTYRVSFGKRQMYSIQFSPIFPTLSTFFPYISLLLHKSWHRNATRINNGEYSRLSNNRTCMFYQFSRANKNESFQIHLEHLNCKLAILHQLNNIKLFFIACHTKGSFTFF